MNLEFFLRTRKQALGGILCAALGIWLGFPNDVLDCPLLVFLWPLALIWLGERAKTEKAAFFQGWLATTFGSMAALYWLAMPVHQVGGLSWPLASICALFIAASLSLQGGLFCCVCRNIANAGILAKIAIIFPFWFLLEYAFALCPAFPWLPLSGALCVWPVMVQSSDAIGAYGTSALWLGALLPAYFAGTELVPRLRRMGAFCASLLLVCLLAGYGFWRLAENPMEISPEGDNSMAALFVEGNVDQNQKWDPVFQRQTLDMYLRLTGEGMAGARAQGISNPLIIWPETAMPFFFEARPLFAREIISCAVEYASPLLFGAPGLERDPDLPEGAVFNRSFLVGPNGAILGYYDKMHLVPFGEYLPSWLKLDFLEALLQGVGIYQEGKDPQPLRYGRLALGMLICYEGIFPWLARERVAAGANILVDISNDGWFGRTPACRQHLYLTALRCIEQNRWLLRCTNTGISAVADARGRITLAGPQFQAGFLLARAKLLQKASIYHIIGPWLPLAAIVLLCVAWLIKTKFYPAAGNNERDLPL